jgi:dihydrofolate reductase
MTISIIVAAATNNAIGKDNQLLWHLPNDMKFFKNTTWGMPVIMGRKTFESLGKPLNGRVNIVITRQTDWQAEGAVVVNNLTDALFVAQSTDCKEAFVIGGGEIYHQALAKAQRIYLTRVNTIIEADTFFPEIDPENWHLQSNTDFAADAKHAFPYSFQLWTKK